jgi:hypothetical protein
MKITKQKLKQIIREELNERIGSDPQHAEQMELRDVADKVVDALGHPTQVRFDGETKTYYIQNLETQAIMMDAEALHALSAAGFVPPKKNISVPEDSEEDDDIGHDWDGGTGKNLPFKPGKPVKNFRGSE